MDGPIPPLLPDHTTRQGLRALRDFLVQQGTFRFPRFPNGLFAAAAGEGADFDVTGYANVWTRDNVHIAHAHLATGDVAVAVQNIESLLSFYATQERRFAEAIRTGGAPRLPQDRPHVRFQGAALVELTERWSHAQNDALGYVLWLACRLARRGHLSLTPAMRETIGHFVHYFDAIRFEQDEDSGHWEEAPKIEASSIGVVVAALTELRELMVEDAAAAAGFGRCRFAVTAQQVDGLIARGRRALDAILPNECIQPGRERTEDAALLFLIYPLEIIDGPQADAVLERVAARLTGPFGIRRYLGDSYWCANYKQLLSAEVRTSDFSDDMTGRDRLLKPGEEAQWCIFDPIVSTIYGRRFLRSGNTTDFERQRRHLERSLAQLTGPSSSFGGYRCPESYYKSAGTYVPNDLTPLLWTQANLLLALQAWDETLAASASH